MGPAGTEGAVVIRKFACAAIALCAMMLGSCNTSQVSSSFAKGTVLSNRTTLQVGEYQSDVPTAAGADGKMLWRQALQRHLANRGILADPADPEAVAVNVRVTGYQRGDNTSAGETRLVMAVTLVQHGHVIGTLNANRTKCCGVFSANAWSSIFQDVAEEVVFEIEKTMGTDS